MEQSLNDLVNYCNERLRVASIEDYEGAVNGLQFQNSGKVRCIASAVDGSLEVIQKAADLNVQLLIVHHGLFWGKHVPIIKNFYEKYKLLIQNDIAVYSCHLPLDGHPEIGNNAQIAKLLGLKNTYPEFEFHNEKVGVAGELTIQRPNLKAELSKHFPKLTAMEFGPDEIHKIGICSGGSGVIISMADQLGINTVITGECSQYLYNIAREHHINAYICGHYATETFGVHALGQELSQKFDLPYQFIPTDCPL